MKILIDMNLSPAWAEYFAAAGLDAQHWSEVGDPKATDRQIMAYGRERGSIVFTHDLDFGNVLAATQALGPSVIQVRTHNPVPDAVGELVLSAVRDHASLLNRGALITIEPEKLRARVLPIVPGIRQ